MNYQNKVLTTEAILNCINNLDMTFHQKEQSILFLENLLNRKETTSNEWIDLPQTYLVKTYGSKFFVWFYKLKEAGILKTRTTSEGIEAYKFISKETKCGIIKDKNPEIKAFCKQYKIGWYFKESNLTFISHILVNKKEFLISQCMSFSKQSINSQQVKQKKTIKSMIEKTTKENLNLLQYNIELLRNVMNDKVKNLHKEFKINSDIKETGFLTVRYCYYDTEKLFTVSPKKEIKKINKEKFLSNDHRNLIKYKGEFYICNDVKDFIEYKKNNIKFSWGLAIKKIENKDFNSFINSTNGRLDSNITNMATELSEEIFKQNNLVQFDLSNSQFALLSHLNPNIDEAFINASNEGKLYEYVMEHLNIDSRSEAKKMMFELFFSSNKAYVETKERLALVFPKTIEYIKRFKNDKENEVFAVMLQKFESKLFINTILHKLYKQKMFALTKHDSIICNKKDAEYVYSIIQEEFDKINFKGTVK